MEVVYNEETMAVVGTADEVVAEVDRGDEVEAEGEGFLDEHGLLGKFAPSVRRTDIHSERRGPWEALRCDLLRLNHDR